jgi:hypothetical protein
VRIPRPLADLSEASRAAWPGLASDLQALHGGYQLWFEFLAETLRVTDELAIVRETLRRDGLTVAGSQGQVRPHPLIATEQTLRREIQTGWERLGMTPERLTRRREITRNGRVRPLY